MFSSSLKPVFPDTASVSSEGHLTLGGCDSVALAAEFGTPLYVYDEATLRARASSYVKNLAAAYAGESLICYAAKAYCAPWLLHLLNEQGLGLDVVSGGELFTAVRSGFPLARVYMHGNNKLGSELRAALQAGVGHVVIDNLDDVQRLGRLTEELGVDQAVLLRVTPGVEAHTHEYIQTGVLDTKFGVALQTGAAAEAVDRIMSHARLRLVGLHAHIGSQIFELDPYRDTLMRLMGFAAETRARHPSFELRELSPGGGFGIRYTPTDDPVPNATSMQAIAQAVRGAADRFNFPLPRLTLEPGRSLVGQAGVALYRVGSVKQVGDVRTYVAVDGGMADNTRPAMYEAQYSGLLANRANEAASGLFTVAGRYCESGDLLIRDAQLPTPRVDDLLAVPASGAYHLAMASNYNLSPRPAVVEVNQGRARLVTRRETYEDLLARETPE